MALVFVHGVNVRYDPANDPYVKARDALFRRSVLTGSATDPEQSLIENPYWGDAAATFPWHHGGLPEGRYEQFGASNSAAAAVVSDLATAGLLDPQQLDRMGGIDPDKVLLTLARHSLPLAIDRLWVAAARNLDSRQAAANAQLSLAVAAYVEANPRPQWLATAKDDKEFLSTLLRHVAAKEPKTAGTPELFGFDDVVDAVREAAGHIRDGFVEIFETGRQAVNAARGEARHWFDEIVLTARTPIHQTVATFLGDAFTYFRQREAGALPERIATIVGEALDRAEAGASPERIVAIVQQALDRANAGAPRERIATIVGEALDRADTNRRATDEPIIVVAHSMGGNIVYDLLTSSRLALVVDVLVTVGSQVAVFEEMKLFAASNSAVPSRAVPKVARPKTSAVGSTFSTPPIS